MNTTHALDSLFLDSEPDDLKNECFDYDSNEQWCHFILRIIPYQPDCSGKELNFDNLKRKQGLALVTESGYLVFDKYFEDLHHSN